MTKPIEVLLQQFWEGRTDLVFPLLESGISADHQNEDGVSLLRQCAYFGDVSAVRFLISKGAALESLGANFDLGGVCFHGHWRLCEFLVEQGADVNAVDPQNGETPLHSALCTTNRVNHDRVLQVLLSHGADPNIATKSGAETGGFMRDARTRGETPLHRAAAFGNEATIRMLLSHGAKPDVRDAHGDSPLSWASWYLRPDPILRLLCFGNFRIRDGRLTMQEYLAGEPAVASTRAE